MIPPIILSESLYMVSPTNHFVEVFLISDNSENITLEVKAFEAPRFPYSLEGDSQILPIFPREGRRCPDFVKY